MTPGKFVAYQERRLGRSLTAEEAICIAEARARCRDGQSATVKAMWAALRTVQLLKP